MEAKKESLVEMDIRKQGNNDESKGAVHIAFNLHPLGIWRAIRRAKQMNRSSEWDLAKKTFAALDLAGNGQIPSQAFINFLRGPFGYRVGLTPLEIEKITFYYKDHATDLVDYRSFIEFIEEPENPHSNPLRNEKEHNLLEKEKGFKSFSKDHTGDNAERDAVSIILDYIAGVMMYKQILPETIVLNEEQFKGKELTYSQLKKIFGKLGIHLEEKDFKILCICFGRNVLQFNWSDFLSELRHAMIKLEKNGKYNPTLIAQNIGKTFKIKFPIQAKSGIRQSDMREFFQNNDSPQNSQERWSEMSEDTVQLITRIQKTFYQHNIMARPHFQQFDRLNSGRITVPQFLRALDECGVSIVGEAKMFIKSTELQSLIDLYTDTTNPGCVVWRAFVSDIESAKCIRDLHRHPSADISDHRPTGLRNSINGLPCKYTIRHSMTVEENHRVEGIMNYLKNKLTEYNVYNIFRAVDKTKRVHLTRCQLREVLSQLNIRLDSQDFNVLETYFLDVHGFCYMSFLQALGSVCPPTDLVPPTAVRIPKLLGKLAPYVTEANTGEEVLKKICTTVFERSLRLKYFMEQYDKHNTGIMDNISFIRALSAAHNWAFTDLEFQKLIELFQGPSTTDIIYYKVFLSVIDEMYTQPHLYRTPLVNPIPYTGRKMLFVFKAEEQLIFGNIIDRFAKLGICLDSIRVFKDFDKNLNRHTVTFSNYLRALETLGVLRYLTVKEIQLVYDVFKRPIYQSYEFDYIRFLETCHNAGLSPLSTN